MSPSLSPKYFGEPHSVAELVLTECLQRLEAERLDEMAEAAVGEMRDLVGYQARAKVIKGLRKRVSALVNQIRKGN